MKDSLLESLNIKELKQTYRCLQRINEGMGARSFFGENIATGEEVFIKFLLFPRSGFEKARFENEIFTLEKLSQYPVTISPLLIDKGRLHDGEILYLVTEKVEGISLDHWIKHMLPGSSISDRLEIFHRVASSVAHFVSMFSHRDLHPGNIILLDKKPTWEGHVALTQVRIIDWGHSFGPLLAQFEDSPDFMIALYDRIPKEVSGSFYCTPPDIFNSSDKFAYNPGKHDAWSLGLLLYKLLTEKELFDFTSIGDFSESLQNGDLKVTCKKASIEISNLDHPSANILSRVFEGLVSLTPESRIDPATAGRIMWDVRIEELILNSEYELNNYIRNPYDYMPKGGWRLSDWPDYD